MSHASKSKEELQNACKALKLKVSGNKTELRRRLTERERELRTAASFFTLKVQGGPYPAPKSTQTPVKSKPNILPKTPASRRKREEDNDSREEGGTPSKKYRMRKLQLEGGEEEHGLSNKDIVLSGRTEEGPGEANPNLSNFREEGGQLDNNSISKGISTNRKLIYEHHHGEDTGRLGEALLKTGGGQNRDEGVQGGLSPIEKGGRHPP